jgi:hypothetical protein
VSRFQHPGPEHAVPGPGLVGGKGDRAARCCLRGRLAGELAVDQALQPGGAGVVAAGGVDAGEDVLGDSEL